MTNSATTAGTCLLGTLLSLACGSTHSAPATMNFAGQAGEAQSSAGALSNAGAAADLGGSATGGAATAGAGDAEAGGSNGNAAGANGSAAGAGGTSAIGGAGSVAGGFTMPTEPPVPGAPDGKFPNEPPAPDVPAKPLVPGLVVSLALPLIPEQETRASTQQAPRC